MKHRTELNHGQKAAQEQMLRASNGALEFSSPEEMLRHDSQGIAVPEEIARRLHASTAHLPPPAKSWWRKLLGS